MKSKLTRFLGIGLAGALTLTSAIVFASDNAGQSQKFNNSVQTQRVSQLTDEQKAQMKEDMLSKLKEKLDARVSSGELTQDEADEIYLNAENGDFKGGGMGMGKGQMMGEKAEPTDEQKAQMLSDLKEKLDAKVSSGEITQDKADEIYSNAENGQFQGIGMIMGAKKGRGQGLGVLANLTDDEKAQLKEAELATLKNILDAKVASGEITQDKADEIYTNAENAGDFAGLGMGRGRRGDREFNNSESGDTTSSDITTAE